MRILIISLISLLVVGASAQTTFEEVAATPEKSGGVYYAYPLDFAPQTPAPKGYKPVYISHYGRHGSRYLLSDRDYKWVIDLLQQAADVQVLSPLGHSALERLQEVWKELFKKNKLHQVIRKLLTIIMSTKSTEKKKLCSWEMQKKVKAKRKKVPKEKMQSLEVSMATTKMLMLRH